VLEAMGRQFVPHGRTVMLSLPGGAGYGKASDRDPQLIRQDLARGYISKEAAMRDYGMSDSDVESVLASVRAGEEI